MASTEPDDLPVVEGPSVPCRHLRTTGMYVYTDGSGDPQDGSDSSNYWCLKTMKSFGPDDDFVSRRDCTADRPCYEPL